MKINDPATLPELVGLALLAKIATDVAEISATMKELAAASKPARRPTAASVEALSQRVLSSLANPYTTGGDRSWTTWGALQRDFGLTRHQRLALSAYWRQHAIVETRTGKGVRIIGCSRTRP